jgi:hypothetical protein
MLVKCEESHKSVHGLWDDYVTYMTEGAGMGFFVDGTPLIEPGFELQCAKNGDDIMESPKGEALLKGKCIPETKLKGANPWDTYANDVAEIAANAEAYGGASWMTDQQTGRRLFGRDVGSFRDSYFNTAHIDVAVSLLSKFQPEICFTCGADPYDETQYNYFPQFGSQYSFQQVTGFPSVFDFLEGTSTTGTPQFLDGFKSSTIKLWCENIGKPYSVPQVKEIGESTYFKHKFKTNAFKDIAHFRLIPDHFGNCYKLQRSGKKVDRQYLLDQNLKTGTLSTSYAVAKTQLKTGLDNGFSSFLVTAEEEYENCKLEAEAPDTRVTASGELSIKAGLWTCAEKWGYAVGAEIYMQSTLKVGVVDRCATITAAGKFRAAAYLRGASSIWKAFSASCACDDSTGRFDDDTKDESTCANIMNIELDVDYSVAISDICEGAKADMHTELSATFKINVGPFSWEYETPDDGWSPIDKDSNGKDIFPAMGDVVEKGVVHL